jgi:hypothetical protein
MHRPPFTHLRHMGHITTLNTCPSNLSLRSQRRQPCLPTHLQQALHGAVPVLPPRACIHTLLPCPIYSLPPPQTHPTRETIANPHTCNANAILSHRLCQHCPHAPFYPPSLCPPHQEEKARSHTCSRSTALPPTHYNYCVNTPLCPNLLPWLYFRYVGVPKTHYHSQRPHTCSRSPTLPPPQCSMAIHSASGCLKLPR